MIYVIIFRYSPVNESEVVVNWERLARANTHPLRVSILEVLGIDGGRRLSPKDLSLELQAPLSTVNYHVTELRHSGLVEVVDERQVRGAIEHFYRLVESGEKGRRRKSRRKAAQRIRA
jgi:predicted ArsR family transcriptional regulator